MGRPKLPEFSPCANTQCYYTARPIWTNENSVAHNAAFMRRYAFFGSERQFTKFWELNLPKLKLCDHEQDFQA